MRSSRGHRSLIAEVPLAEPKVESSSGSSVACPTPNGPCRRGGGKGASLHRWQHLRPPLSEPWPCGDWPPRDPLPLPRGPGPLGQRLTFQLGIGVGDVAGSLPER